MTCLTGVGLRPRAPRHSAPVRSHDRGGNADLQDGQAHQAALRPDARSQVCHLDGQLLELRRAVSIGLFGLQGRGQDHSRRRLRSRLPAAPRSAHRRALKDSRQDDARALAGESSAAGWGHGCRIGMDAKDIYARLKRQFPGKVRDFKGEVKEPYLTVDALFIVDVCRFLRDDTNLQFEVLSDLTALDWPKEEKLQVVYHLFSYGQNHQIVLKVDLPRDNPKVATVEGVWKVANWFEREVYDLFGVIFEGHSDLRRIMLPEDWVGYPLRKDYVEQEEYDGISTQRAPLVEKLLR